MSTTVFTEPIAIHADWRNEPKKIYSNTNIQSTPLISRYTGYNEMRWYMHVWHDIMLAH